MYRDPISAGAYLLSAYMDDEAAFAKTFAMNPSAFGSLATTIDRASAEKVYALLIAGIHGMSLAKCTRLIKEQCDASFQIAKFASHEPALYWNFRESELRSTPRVGTAKSSSSVKPFASSGSSLNRNGAKRTVKVL